MLDAPVSAQRDAELWALIPKIAQADLQAAAAVELGWERAAQEPGRTLQLLEAVRANDPGVPGPLEVCIARARVAQDLSPQPALGQALDHCVGLWAARARLLASQVAQADGAQGVARRHARVALRLGRTHADAGVVAAAQAVLGG